MLPRAQRLHASLVGRVMRGGRRFVGHLGVLRVTWDEGSPAFKFGVGISKAVVRKAVDRNRVRRRVYGAVQELSPFIEKGTTSFFQLKRDISDLSAHKLRAEIEIVLRSAGIITNPIT